MDQRIINLYDEYTHKPLSRNEFLNRLAKITGSTAAAIAILPLIEVNTAHAATVSDENLITEKITYPGEGGDTMAAYIARPKGKKPKAAVMVIHENRGLNAHIEDVARRVANAGFIGFAPDALAPFGGAPTDADKAREMFTKLDPKKNLSNFLKGFEYLKQQKYCNKKFACVGFCWGGALTNQMAVNFPELKAAAPFYGRQPEAADVPKIKAALMLHYAATDERINAGIAAYEEALKQNKIEYQNFIYEGTQHAFHNDTAPTRYNADAAKLAWSRTMEFFKGKLG